MPEILKVRLLKMEIQSYQLVIEKEGRFADLRNLLIQIQELHKLLVRSKGTNRR